MCAVPGLRGVKGPFLLLDLLSCDICVLPEVPCLTLGIGAGLQAH